MAATLRSSGHSRPERGSGSFNPSRWDQVNQQIEGIDNDGAANNSAAANQGGLQGIPVASSGQPGIGPGEPFNMQLALKFLL
jgi:hypothetical protein